MVGKLGAWLRRPWFSRKLTTTSLTASAAALTVACAVFATYDYVSSRQRLVRDVAMLADILGANCTAALTFGDAVAAGETLQAISVNDNILNAQLFTRDRLLLATYLRPGLTWNDTLVQHQPPPDGDALVVFDHGHVRVVRPIVMNDQPLGTIIIESDTTEVSSRLGRFAAIAALTLVGAFFIDFTNALIITLFLNWLG